MLSRHHCVMAYSRPDEPTENSGLLRELLKASTIRPTSVRCSGAVLSNRMASGASATIRVNSRSMASRPPANNGSVNFAIFCAVCADKCRARSASVIGVMGCVPMMGWRSRRCTRPSVPERAKRLPNAQYRPSAGVPPTIGTTPLPKAARARSITWPMLPMLGELSKVEHTL